MKEIKAYVHRDRIADVIAAVKDCADWAGPRHSHRHNLAVYLVKGSLVASDSKEQHYATELGDEVINEYKLELLCEDDEVDTLVDAIVAAARTGQAVAGWVTVADLSRVVPIH